MVETVSEHIGIDISKAHLDVSTYPAGGAWQFTNDAKGHRAFIKWLGPLDVRCIAFEPTGPYHRALERVLVDRGLPCAKINPRQARRFAEAAGRLAKNDRVDAMMLARFGALLQPRQATRKSRNLETLGELVTARRALVKDRTATRNRLYNLLSCLLKRQAKQRLKQIEAHIAVIDAECRAQVEADDRLNRHYDILISIPGIGEITVMTLMAQMPELGAMDKKQVASLAGLAPVTRQSGTWRGKSFIRGGRATLRQALYMPALSAIRHNDELKQKYDALRKNGKPAKVAITAIMRKLITIANALIRDKRKWAEIIP